MTRKTRQSPAPILPELAQGRLLTVEQAAERLNTSVRFPRRLIAERRIAFVHVGRNVRIPEAALEAFIAAGLVEPITPATLRKGRAA
ncbi:helix-turn-helix domain-containing protein [Streptosporangium sandarakinum]|uniref:helix-turn-helix domain-containing protein n=1 Tax=Streptosporangium sandarakinum TaxID=1260955 RepID=UPI0033A84B7D